MYALPDLPGIHLGNGFADLRSHGTRDSLAKKLNDGNKYKIRQNAAAHHKTGDLRTNNIADAQQRRIIVRTDRPALEALFGKVIAR